MLQDLNINCSKDIFSLMHINARSINKNIETIYQMLSSPRVSFDIIGISETWISELNDLIQIEEYIYVIYRAGGPHGKKTVPEVLSTGRGRRPRAVLKTKGTVFFPYGPT